MIDASPRILHKKKPPRDELASIRGIFNVNPASPAVDPDRKPEHVEEEETVR